MADTLRKKLRAALADGRDLSDVLAFDESRPLALSDAVDLCDFLAEQRDVRPLLDTTSHGEYSTPLYALALAFEASGDETTGQYLIEHGLPHLLRLCDLALAEPAPPPHPLGMIANIFTVYGYEQGVEPIAVIGRRFPNEVQSTFWLMAEKEHPHGPDLIELLRDPLPTGFAAVLTLDLANALCRQSRLVEHPFDSPAGYSMLEAWLRDSNPENFSYALSAAASLPFIADDFRGGLAALAMDHHDPSVQMEAAWASAYRGNEAGVRFLSRSAGDPRFALTAQGYLVELGRADAIPEAAHDPRAHALQVA